MAKKKTTQRKHSNPTIQKNLEIKRALRAKIATVDKKLAVQRKRFAKMKKASTNRMKTKANTLKIRNRGSKW